MNRLVNRKVAKMKNSNKIKKMKNFVKRINKKNLKKFTGILLLAFQLKVNTKSNPCQPILLIRSPQPVIEQIIQPDSNLVDSHNIIVSIRGGGDKTGPMAKAQSKVANLKNRNTTFKTSNSSNHTLLPQGSNHTTVKTSGVDNYNYTRRHTPSASELPVPPKPRITIVKRTDLNSSTKFNRARVKKTEELNIDSVSKPTISKPKSITEEKQKPTQTTSKPDAETKDTETLKATMEGVQIGILKVNEVVWTGKGPIVDFELNLTNTGVFKRGVVKAKWNPSLPDGNDPFIRKSVKIGLEGGGMLLIPQVNQKLINEAAGYIGNTNMDSFPRNATDVAAAGCNRAFSDARYAPPCLAIMVGNPAMVVGIDLGLTKVDINTPIVGKLSMTAAALELYSLSATSNLLINDHKAITVIDHKPTTTNSISIQQNLENRN